MNSTKRRQDVSDISKYIKLSKYKTLHTKYRTPDDKYRTPSAKYRTF